MFVCLSFFLLYLPFFLSVFIVLVFSLSFLLCFFVSGSFASGFFKGGGVAFCLFFLPFVSSVRMLQRSYLIMLCAGNPKAPFTVLALKSRFARSGFRAFLRIVKSLLAPPSLYALLVADNYSL